MLKKALRWLLTSVLILILLLLVSGVGLYFYIQKNQYRAVQLAAEQLGLEVSYASAVPTIWATFPKVSLSLDSLTVRDPSRSPAEPSLLEAQSLHAAFSLHKMWRDTLVWKNISLRDATIFFAADSMGKYNMGNLLPSEDSPELKSSPKSISLFNPYIDLNEVTVTLDNVGVAYLDPPKHKKMQVRFDSVRMLAQKIAPGRVELTSCIDVDIGGLSFNTEKGSYLQHSPLRGCFEASLRDTTWVLDTTDVTVGPDIFQLAGSVGPHGLHLHIINDSLNYDRTRVLLHDTLQVRLANYHVEGPFGVVADVYNYPGNGNDVEVAIRFATQNQPVRIRAFQFQDVTTSGVFGNRLPEDQGGTPGSTTEFLINTDTTIARYDGMLIKSPHAITRGWPTDAHLNSPINLTGSAAALARLFGNTEFLFTQGGFVMNTHVNASLNRVDEIINNSDGNLTFRDLEIEYAPANVRFPFQQLRLDKEGKDVRFNFKRGALKNGLEFDLVGYLDNILPLLMNRPADSLRTEVIFHAERGDWSSFRELFGEEGYFKDQPKAGTEPKGQVQRMKQTLLGLGDKFRPHLQMVVDTLTYYDALTLLDFRAGLLFNQDILVLEKSRFDWLGSTVHLDAQVGLGETSRTPFALGVLAEELDLNAMRKPLQVFGLELPAGLNTLPENLDINFAHRGVINDTFGIQPGSNRGELTFWDGAANLFTGRLSYQPSAAGLQTNLLLSGDPIIVNDLFASQDFFFETGHFSIDLKILGQPASLEALLKQSDLKLVIDTSKVSYRPAGVYVPIEKMIVNALGDETEFDLKLRTDSTNRLVALTGVMDQLSAFLYPKAGEPFNLRAAIAASRLDLSDIFELVQLQSVGKDSSRSEGVTAPPDSIGFDPQLLLSTTEGIFRTFSPDLLLRIDTFQVNEATRFTDLRSGIRLLDSTLLVVENTGFSLGQGSMNLAATYGLDHQETSPFTLQWEGQDLSLKGLVATWQRLKRSDQDFADHFKGTFSSTGDVRGLINEANWQLPYERVNGKVTFHLQEGALSNLPFLETIGRKTLMRKRFEEVLLGPIDITVTLDSGRMSVPQTEIQSTAMQFFVEGQYDTVRGPDLLLSIPLRNIGRGKLDHPPAPTGYGPAGPKVYVVLEPDERGNTQVHFRLGRRKYYRDRGNLPALKRRKEQERMERRKARQARKKN